MSDEIREFVGMMHVYYIEEREIGALYDGVDKGIRDMYSRIKMKLTENLIKTRSGEEKERIYALEESVTYLWEDWMNLRLSKIIKSAEAAARGEKSDMSGAFSWEITGYEKIRDSIGYLLDGGMIKK